MTTSTMATPSAYSQTLSSLPQLLQLEQQYAAQLLALIEREHELLSNGDIDPLPPLTEQKGRAVTALQQTSQRREQLLVQNGFSADFDGLGKALATSNSSGELTALANKLRETAVNCQKLNNLNGRLVSRRHAQSRTALNILQGRSNVDTYTQQGLANTPAQARELGKA